MSLSGWLSICVMRTYRWYSDDEQLQLPTKYTIRLWADRVICSPQLSAARYINVILQRYVMHVVCEPLAGFTYHVRTKFIACPGSRLRLIPFQNGLEVMFAKYRLVSCGVDAVLSKYRTSHPCIPRRCLLNIASVHFQGKHRIHAFWGDVC